jgi:hypothetical protein
MPYGSVSVWNRRPNLGLHPKNPIITSIDQLDPKVPLTFIYGGKSWITSDSGKMIQDLRKDSYVDVQEIKGAGHHVYADRPFMFNQVCNEVFQVSTTGKRRMEMTYFWVAILSGQPPAGGGCPQEVEHDGPGCNRHHPPSSGTPLQFVDQHCSNVDASNCCAPPSKDDYEGEMRKEKPRGWAPVKPKKDSQS